MKKRFGVLLILLIACASLFAGIVIPPETVLITANVPDGAGVNGDDSINLGGGVFLTIAIPREGDIPSNEAPKTWNNASYTPIEENEPVIAKLVDADTNKNACEKFYLAYGLKGNPSKRVNVKISAEVDGWYPGTNGKGESKASENMIISSNTVPKNPTETTFITSSVGTNNGINVVFNNGLTASEVLVGYSEITWEIINDYTPPAGDYSATVTIKIDSDGEVPNGGESA